MQEAQAIIERVRRVSATIQRLDVAVDRAHADIGPGQLLLARTTDSYDPYLREPWTPVGRQGALLTIERPTTRSYAPSQIVSLIGPVGRPIPLRDSTRALLLVAYESSPVALLMLANTVLARGGTVALALIGQAQHYPLEVLPKELEVVRSVDHKSWTERSKTLAWADQVVAVAPPGFDLTAYSALLEDIRTVRIEPAPDYVYGLFHAPMPCGVGACMACMVRVSGEDVPACIDGPAFDLLTVSLTPSTAQAARDG